MVLIKHCFTTQNAQRLKSVSYMYVGIQIKYTEYITKSYTNSLIKSKAKRQTETTQN